MHRNLRSLSCLSFHSYFFSLRLIPESGAGSVQKIQALKSGLWVEQPMITAPVWRTHNRGCRDGLLVAGPLLPFAQWEIGGGYTELRRPQHVFSHDAR